MAEQAKLNVQQIDALQFLDEHVTKCMRSKRVLRVLSELQDKGLIEFNPFAGTAKLTSAGEAALASNKLGGVDEPA